MDPAQELELNDIKRYQVINETIAEGNTDIQKFYDGAVVFVTGGTGFLGKQLLEKLFRSCNIDKIYLLMRAKKKQSIEERLQKIMSDPVYNVLRDMKPNFQENVIPVSGDVTEFRLGLSDKDWNRLTSEVTIIYHGAAIINFEEPLKVATLTNVGGTLEMIHFGKACKCLKSFVHISTAYSHATNDHVRKPVYEKFYDSPIQPDTLMKLVTEVDSDKLDAMTSTLIKKWPNTYAFTKAVAEEAMRTEGKDLPACIVRPAIVVSACREPNPGWIDKSCALGPSGFLLGTGLGALHTLYRSKDINLDLVPVDLVNNAIIAAAYQTVVKRQQGQYDCMIYTVTSTRNPLVFGHLGKVMRSEAMNVSSNYTIYAGFCVETDNKLLYLLATYLLHYIPGLIVDGILKLFGKRPIALKLYKLAFKLNHVMGYFMTNYWCFQDSNLQEMYNSLSPADRIIYNSDLSIIDWTHYILIWCIGIRKYILKDGISKTRIGQRKQFWFRIINPFVLALYFYILYKVLEFVYLCLYHSLLYCHSIGSSLE